MFRMVRMGRCFFATLLLLFLVKTPLFSGTGGFGGGLGGSPTLMANLQQPYLFQRIADPTACNSNSDESFIGCGGALVFPHFDDTSALDPSNPYDYHSDAPDINHNFQAFREYPPSSGYATLNLGYGSYSSVDVSFSISDSGFPLWFSCWAGTTSATGYQSVLLKGVQGVNAVSCGLTPYDPQNPSDPPVVPGSLENVTYTINATFGGQTLSAPQTAVMPVQEIVNANLKNPLPDDLTLASSETGVMQNPTIDPTSPFVPPVQAFIQTLITQDMITQQGIQVPGGQTLSAGKKVMGIVFMDVQRGQAVNFFTYVAKGEWIGPIASPTGLSCYPSGYTLKIKSSPDDTSPVTVTMKSVDYRGQIVYKGTALVLYPTFPDYSKNYPIQDGTLKNWSKDVLLQHENFHLYNDKLAITSGLIPLVVQKTPALTIQILKDQYNLGGTPETFLVPSSDANFKSIRNLFPNEPTEGCKYFMDILTQDAYALLAGSEGDAYDPNPPSSGKLLWPKMLQAKTFWGMLAWAQRKWDTPIGIYLMWNNYNPTTKKNSFATQAVKGGHDHRWPTNIVKTGETVLWSTSEKNSDYTCTDAAPFQGSGLVCGDKSP